MPIAPNYANILKGQQATATAAAQPVVSSLEAQRQPIADRYASLIDQIKSNQTAAIGGQQTTSSREFGRRGIPLSSGVFETTLEERLNPIRREYSGLLGQTGAERESALAQLTSQIAGVRGNALQNAIAAAQSLYGTQYAGYQSELNRIAQERANAASRAAATAAVPTFNTQMAKALTQALGGGAGGAPTLPQAFKSLASNLKGGFQEFASRMEKLPGLSATEKRTLVSMYNKVYTPVKFT